MGICVWNSCNLPVYSGKIFNLKLQFKIKLYFVEFTMAFKMQEKREQQKTESVDQRFELNSPKSLTNNTRMSSNSSEIRLHHSKQLIGTLKLCIVCVCVFDEKENLSEFCFCRLICCTNMYIAKIERNKTIG